MPSKIYEVEGIGPVTIVKSRRSRHLKLSVTAKNQARVSIPSYVPYAAGLKFAISKKGWLKSHLSAHPANVYQDGARIGKSYRLRFEVNNSVPRVKIKGNEVIVYGDAAALQPEIEKYCEKAVRKDADKLLPLRLEDLARRYNFSYKEVRIRKLTSRWGSCSSDKLITLSLLLVQLPWDLIDYVILHELNHTVHMNHGPRFWADMEKLVPGARAKRKELKSYKSSIMPVTA